MEDERDRPLRESDLGPDPVAVPRRRLEEARAAGAELPEAMALATASPDAAPSVRMVLLRRSASLTPLPSTSKFWQHRADRLHDRFRYRPGGRGWAIERLAP